MLSQVPFSFSLPLYFWSPTMPTQMLTYGILIPRRKASIDKWHELMHANETPAEVPQRLRKDTRVRKIEGDQAQCNLCGRWTLFHKFDEHQQQQHGEYVLNPARQFFSLR